MTTYQPYIATHNSFWTKIKKLDKSPPKDSVPRGIYCQTPTPTSSRPGTSASLHRPSHDKANHSQTSLSSSSRMSRSRSQSQTSLASGGGRRAALDHATSNRKLTLFPAAQSTSVFPSAAAVPHSRTPRASEDTVATNASSKCSSEHNPHYYHETAIPDVPTVSPIHSLPPSPIESDVILPDYTLDFFLENNPPGVKADFLVFRSRYRLRSDHSTTQEGSLPAGTDPRLWESNGIVGHKYEVTPYGTLIYHGPFSESAQTRASMADAWGSRNSAINSVKDPNSGRYTIHEAGEDFYPQEIPVRCKAISLDLKKDLYKNLTGTWTRLWGKTTYTCAPEDRAVITTTPSSARLKVFTDLSSQSHGQQSNGARSVRIYCSFAWLVATIVAKGNIEPKDVGKYIYLDKYVSYDRSGNGSGAPVWTIPLIRLRIPPGRNDWNSKDGGWMYTERKGMEVLVG